MIVLDASCLVSLFRGEPGSSDVVAAMVDQCTMNVLNRAEVIDQLTRRGATSDVVGAELDTLGINFESLSIELADNAGRLRSRHYHRSKRPLSMADCVALATALELGSALATSDVHLAATCVDVGCEVVEIANSKGAYPIRK
ncbi:MAG: PIN domain-containing protein [Actinomycetota bacterium]|nr:PIN domain-containing protein [Actinomycetota bacterium]